jgi:hypothetical protein
LWPTSAPFPVNSHRRDMEDLDKLAAVAHSATGADRTEWEADV